MTEEEREKLIDKMVVAMSTHIPGDNVQSGDVFDAAIDSLAIAEEAIRKDCAEIARNYEILACDTGLVWSPEEIAVVILASIPEPPRAALKGEK
jgi:hypothetical protein